MWRWNVELWSSISLVFIASNKKANGLHPFIGGLCGDYSPHRTTMTQTKCCSILHFGLWWCLTVGFAYSGASGTYISFVEVGCWIRHSSGEAFVSPYEDNTVLALYRILAGWALSCWTGELDERIVGRCICAMYSVTRLDESSVCVVSPHNEGWHTHRCVTKIFTPKFVAY